MKILVVAGKLTYSNSARYTMALLGGLRNRGHELQVAALGGPLYPMVASLGIESYLVKFNYFSYRRLLRYLKEFDPDLIHASGGIAALQTATKIARSLGTPLIHTVHSWLQKDRDERFPRQVRGIIAVNQNLREHLVNEQNVPKQKIRVVPYGIDAEACSVAAESGGGDRIPVVGTIGRLERGRGHDQFLDAAKIVRDHVGEVHFMIAGEGPGEDSLRDRVKKLDLESVVTFVQPQGDQMDIYRILDILVIVSDWGGVGFNLLEGMARARPIIATGGGEVYSLLGEERVSIITPAGDTEKLAQSIIELIADEELRRELGSNARQYVRNHHPLEEQVIRIEEYYGDVVASSGV